MAALPEPSLKGAFFLPAVGVFAHSRSLDHLVFLFFEQRYKSVYTYKAPACMLSPNMGVWVLDYWSVRYVYKSFTKCLGD